MSRSSRFPLLLALVVLAVALPPAGEAATPPATRGTLVFAFHPN